MLAQSQLSQLVYQHIYLFQKQIQTNAHQLSFDTNKKDRSFDASQKDRFSVIQNQECKQKQELKIDLWKVNHQINHNNCNDQYVGPILSFQRRQIWAKHDHNHNEHHNHNPNHKMHHNQKHQMHLTDKIHHNDQMNLTDQNEITKQRSQPKQNGFSQTQQQSISDLSVTVINPSSNQKRQSYKSNNFSLSKNNNTHQEPLFSTVKPYLSHQVQQKQIYPKNSQKQIGSRVNNFFANNLQENSRINHSSTKRRHKIFSLSSKVQRLQQSHQKPVNHISTANKDIAMNYKAYDDNNVSNLPQQSRPHSSHKPLPNNQIVQRFAEHHSIPRQAEHHSILVDQSHARHIGEQSVKEHVKFNLNQMKQKDHQYQNLLINQLNKGQKHQQISIINHFTTIPNIKTNQYTTIPYIKTNHFTTIPYTKTKPKQRPISPFKTLIQTDYVPSPSQLSTILHTIESQSKEVKNSRKNTQNRKSLYHKRLNNSIRYHEQNFNDSTQEINRDPYNREQQFVPLHPRFFQPNQIALQHPTKVKFSYLDPNSTKNLF